MPSPTVLSSQIVHTNPWWCVRCDELAWPNGHQGSYYVVEARKVAAILAIKDDAILTVRQYRHPIGEDSCEIPAGLLDEGESPEQAARRELQEEAGYTGTMRPLGIIHRLSGISTNTVYLFCAYDLVQARATTDVTASDLTSQWIPLSEFRQMIRDGKITDAGTLAAWAMYQEQIVSRTVS